MRIPESTSFHAVVFRMRAWLFMAGCLWLCNGLAEQPNTDAGFEGERTLVIGKISDNPSRDFAGLEPLIDYVAARMGDLGVTHGKILIARDHRQMLSYARQGKVDWITETVGSGLLFKHGANARILARRWKYGEAVYKTTIFVRRDSDIQTLDDLLGHTIGFEHPGSTTGFMVAAVDIKRAGLEMALMGTPRERPPAHMVGYFFSGDEVNTSTWVHKRLMDAGAIANTDWTREDQVPSAFKADLRIIHEGEMLPRSVELVRDGLDPAIVERLLQIMLEAHEDPEGKVVLEGFQQTGRFDPYVAEQWPYVEGLWGDLQGLLSGVN